MRERAVDREGAHEPDTVLSVVGDRRVGCGVFLARRRRVGRRTGKEAAPPGAPGVGRHGRADVGGGTVRAAADLEGRDDGRSPGEAVGLDGGLVLAVRVRVRVDRQAPRDDLAVRGNQISGVRTDDVRACTAIDAVEPAEGDLYPVGARTRGHTVGVLRACDQFPARGPMDRRGRRGRRQGQQQQDGKETAHAGRPAYRRDEGGAPLARCARLELLSRGASDPALREHSGAFSAHETLELVRNACTLHDNVRADGPVPVGKPQDAKRCIHL